MGVSNDLSCEAGSFSCHFNSYRFFQSEVLRFYFPTLGSGVAWFVSLPSCSSWFICTRMWDHQVLHLPPCHKFSPPSCPSLPLLPVWMNVSSLTPWLSDYHRVRFSGSSGYFLFLNLLLFFFSLCEAAKCIYLRLHLGWKS